MTKFEITKEDLEAFDEGSWFFGIEYDRAQELADEYINKISSLQDAKESLIKAFKKLDDTKELLFIITACVQYFEQERSYKNMKKVLSAAMFKPSSILGNQQKSYEKSEKKTAYHR